MQVFGKVFLSAYYMVKELLPKRPYNINDCHQQVNMVHKKKASHGATIVPSTTNAFSLSVG